MQLVNQTDNVWFLMRKDREEIVKIMLVGRSADEHDLTVFADDYATFSYYLNDDEFRFCI